MITSKQNPLIKDIRALLTKTRARSESQSFVIEGVRLAEEALAAGWPIKGGIYSDSLSARGQEALAKLVALNVEMQLCSPELMKSVSDTQNPQGLLLIIGQKEEELPELSDFVLILDAIHDPGNMGSLLRSAAGAGVEAVLLGPQCVDAFSPKVLRSAMGAQFRLPLHSMNWNEINSLLTAQNFATYVSDVENGMAYNTVEYKTATALVLGSEAQGIGPEARKLGGEYVHIPMANGLESLNAAAAGAILLFEIARQKRGHSG